MKKLILFVHGLGGDENSWGKFPALIKKDKSLNHFDIQIYQYPTSLIRVKNIISPFSKILSLFTHQSKLPKIQDIASALKTEIDNRYSSYDEIYLITHSMGGLVAKKYLIDEIRIYQKSKLKVKKLLLFAVPNNGSELALISKLYPHEQIEQLNKSSDFMESLNNDFITSKIEKYIDTRYVIGLEDEIVDRQSSQARWANQKIEALHKGHINIVKPIDENDLSFVVFRNFVLKENQMDEIEKRDSANSNVNNNNVNVKIKNIIKPPKDHPNLPKTPT